MDSWTARIIPEKRFPAGEALGGSIKNLNVREALGGSIKNVLRQEARGGSIEKLFAAPAGPDFSNSGAEPTLVTLGRANVKLLPCRD